MGRSAKSACNKSRELRAIILENFSSLLVERVSGIRFEHEVEKSVNNGGNREDGFPVFAEDVEANVAVKVDVGMVDRRFAFNFGRIVGIEWFDEECEFESGIFPEPFIGANVYVKVHDIVGIREVDFARKG